MRPKVSFTYKNHRGEVARRHVVVDAIEYVEDPGFGYSPGWFISGQCLTKGERRSFAFVNIDPADLEGPRGVRRLLLFHPSPASTPDTNLWDK